MAEQPKEDDYVFDRSYIDNARLNLQHKLWIDIFGHMLHPDIPTSAPDLKIADIGAGTGMWLRDISRTLPPTAQLDGFDISLKQAEPLAWFPSNVTLRNWDAFSDVPADLVGKYDVVHLRLFVFVVPPEVGPKPLLENLMKLLKPGGYIQWAEPDAVNPTLIKTNPSNPSVAVEKLTDMFKARGGKMQPTWIRDLPAVFSEMGLEGVKNHVVKADARDQYLMVETNFLAYESFFGKGGEALQKLCAESIKEQKAGVALAVDRVSVIGRKPLDVGN